MPIQLGPFYLGPPSVRDRAAVEANAISLPFSFPHVGITRTAPPLPEAVAAEGWTIDHNRVQVGQGRQAYRKAQRLLQQWRHFDLGWSSVNAPPVKQGQPVVVTARTLMCWSCNPLRISFVEEGGLHPGQLAPWMRPLGAAGGAAGAAAGAAAAQHNPPSSASQRQRRGSGGSNSSSSSRHGPHAGAASLQRQKQAATRPPRGRRYAFGHTTLAGHQISGEERFAVAWNQEDDSVWYEIYTLSRPGSWITVLTQPLLRAFQRKFAADSMAAMQREMLKP